MTTIYFIDGTLEYANAKTARAKLRKMGLTVRNAKKQGQDYYFNTKKPEGAVSLPVAKTKAIKEPHSSAIKEPRLTLTTDLTKSRSAVLPNKGTREHTVLQSNIRDKKLTPDYRGIHTIIHYNPYTKEETHRYEGFYSQESGGLLSYRVD